MHSINNEKTPSAAIMLKQKIETNFAIAGNDLFYTLMLAIIWCFVIKRRQCLLIIN